MNLTETKDFYKESGNEEKAKYFSNHIVSYNMIFL